MKSIIFVLVVALLSGCTDAGMSKITSLGNSARITCWSGSSVIYDGESTGKVLNEANSDGYYFRDKADGNLKEVSGNCVIVYR